ncbi:MAG: hypothetical protein JNM84_12270 [Planctomycetes bacterium]|nr:hypothetical protein [Planctomycetota bacterium]
MVLRSELVAGGVAAALACAALLGVGWALLLAPGGTRGEAVLAADERSFAADAVGELRTSDDVRESRSTDAAARELRSESASGVELEVLVRDAESGVAVADASISLWIEGAAPSELVPWRSRLALCASRVVRSDRAGRAFLPTPDRRGLAFVRAARQLADGRWLAETAVIDAAAERVELELRAARCERRRVVFEGCAPPDELPPPGVALALTRHGSWSWRVAASWIGANELEILAPAELRFDALLALPTAEGWRFALVEDFGAAEDAPEALSAARVRVPRALRVQARDEVGAPREGLALRAQVEGELGVQISGVTDARGEVLLGGFFGGAVELGSDVGTTTQQLARCDLESGDRSVAVVLPSPRSVLLAPRGLAPLPALRRARWIGATSLGEPELLDDAWRLRFAPASLEAPLRLELAIEGCVPCELELTVPPRDREERIELEVLREASLVVALVEPDDGLVDLELQRARPGARGWDLVSRRSRRAEIDLAEEAAPLRFDALRPGRYRAMDRRSGATSIERELRAGEERELLLDLSAARWAFVRVAIPDGQRRELLRLEAEMLGTDGTPTHTRCEVREREDGFEVRVPGDRDVRVVAEHPRLVARGAGSGVLRTGHEELELALEAGAELRFRVARELRSREVSLAARREGESAWRAMRVLGWRSQNHRVPGLEPGIYDLCFETPSALPVVFRGQRIPAGELDLGELRFERGGAVRASVRDPEAREDGSFLYELELQELGSAAELGREPRRVRSGFTALEDEELELLGLGAGTWRIELRRRDAWSTESRTLPCSPSELALDGRERRELVLEVGAAR